MYAVVQSLPSCQCPSEFKAEYQLYGVEMQIKLARGEIVPRKYENWEVLFGIYCVSVQ